MAAISIYVPRGSLSHTGLQSQTVWGSPSFAGAQCEAQTPCSLGRTPAIVTFLLVVGHLPRGVVLTVLHLHPSYRLVVVPSLYL